MHIHACVSIWWFVYIGYVYCHRYIYFIYTDGQHQRTHSVNWNWTENICNDTLKLLAPKSANSPWKTLDILNSHGAGTFVYPYNYRSRNRHRNLRDRQCVSSWWPLDWFGYLHELYIDIWFIFISLTGWGVPLVLLPRVRGFWYGFVGVCSLTYCNGNFRFTRVSQLLIVIL